MKKKFERNAKSLLLIQVLPALQVEEKKRGRNSWTRTDLDWMYVFFFLRF